MRPNVCECQTSKGMTKAINANHMKAELGNGWIKVVKRPIPIYVKKMEKDFWLQTLEGKMIGRAGDYIAIGVMGERYIIREKIFEATYEIIEK